MTLLYKILRTVLVTLVLLALAVPAVTYTVLSLPVVQRALTEVGRAELSKLLGAEVDIESASIAPFNKVTLHGVSVITAPGDTALKVERLGAGVRLGKLLLDKKIVFSYAEIIGLNARLYRDSIGSPLNIQPIIDHLSPKEPKREPTPFDLAIDNIVIRRSRLLYDVLSAPRTDSGKIDFKHLAISDIKADVRLPKLSNGNFVIDLRRLAAKERSGLTLSSLSARAHISDTTITVEDMAMRLPASTITFNQLQASWPKGEKLGGNLAHLHLAVATDNDCHIAPRDFGALLPLLRSIDTPLTFDLKGKGTVDNLTLSRLALTAADGAASITVSGAEVKGLPCVDSLRVNLPQTKIVADGSRVADVWRRFGSIKPRVIEIADTLGLVSGTVEGTLAPGDANLLLALSTQCGDIDLDASYRGTLSRLSGPLKLTCSATDVNAGAIAGVKGLGRVTSVVEFDGELMPGSHPQGLASVNVASVEWGGCRFNDITADLVIDRETLGGTVEAATDSLLAMTLTGSCGLTPGRYDIIGDINISALNLTRLGLVSKGILLNRTLSGHLTADLHGPDIESLDGRIEVNSADLSEHDGSSLLHLDHLSLRASGSTSPSFIMLHSDILDGRLEGDYRLRGLLPTIKGILAEVFPALFPQHQAPDNQGTSLALLADTPMEAELDVTLRQNATTDSWLRFFKSPVRILRPVAVKGLVSSSRQLIEASINAPNLLQKDKFIDNTFVGLTVDGLSNEARVLASTIYPTKNGPATINIGLGGSRDSVSMQAQWDIARERKFSGAFDVGAHFSRVFDENRLGALATAIDLRPSRVVINDTLWRISPSVIEISGNRRIAVKGFEAGRKGQFIKINGVASPDPDDRLCLTLNNVDLGYVFETLNISAVKFGGAATGQFYASGLMTPEPRLETPRLNVKDFSYNGALLGQAILKSNWDNESRGVVIKADVTNPGGYHSYVDGAIYPMADSLDFTFNAKHLNAAFLGPFLSGFASDVSGNATGKVRLFGTFRNINIEGDALAEDFGLRLNFTNTRYHVTDSIHLRPGLIQFHDAKIRDDYGHTAILDGTVSHDCFRDICYEFKVSDARELLSYDVGDKVNPIWYGRVFGNGSVYVKGSPSAVDINVNMATAQGTVFTLVLNNGSAAGEYRFLTFNDRRDDHTDLLLNVEHPEEAALLRLKEEIRKEVQQVSNSAAVRINLQVDVTPQAELSLLMDPNGNDRIRSRGDGNLRLEYNTADNDVHMFGTYTLTQGNYTFTLQDIIIKDFSIKPGSSISFHGSPYDAMLDIVATYSVTANLSDLDESFSQDKELNRTNVPVHALLKVTGDLRQPDIAFDLEFPTLTRDIYRKVKSIVSTDDMMNRQIIYLLALNKFYTPEYMGSTSKGNELVSVASSTLSSQLGSLLGSLSDKWNIAPAFRSDRGDFSDMEVDLALSSYLLDNRLLFNGNFGYRDKALNNNSFIGDFDLEYLLNKSGNVRLKAYNRYNDQNYYVKTALTTQGVGVVFKRDFDDFAAFLRRLRLRRAAQDDSTKMK